MTVTGPGAPTLGGFQAFITNVMGVPPVAYNAADPVIGYSFDFALDWVTQELALVGSQPSAYTMYARAVYNLAADTLINWSQDPTDAPAFKDELPYWAWLRKQYGVLNFTAGVVQATSDESTSTTLLVPEAFKNLTIANLGNLKTPYGRAYLGIAQSLGTLWGLS